MMSIPKRVFIVDDHPLVREGLAAKIERDPEFTLCGEASDVDTALAMLSDTLPDIILVDISLPKSSGLSLIKTVHRQYPQTKLIVISMHEESVYGPRARRAGADGYVSKDDAAGVMIEAMHTVMAGGKFFDERLPDFESETTPLTPREFQVFEMIGQGLTIAPIAEALNVSGKTIEAHRENIKLKLGLQTSHDLTVYATRWFAFPPPGETTVPR